MGRVVFFLCEALRALRRSAAPSVAAIVTIVVTTLLLGVFIPVLRASESKANEVRDQLGLAGLPQHRRDPGARSTSSTRSSTRSRTSTARRVRLADLRQEGPRRLALRRRPRGLDLRAELATRCRRPSRSRPTTPTTSRRSGPRCTPTERGRQADADQPRDRSADRREPRGARTRSAGHQRGQDRPAR